jgi:transposase InsO family protein
MNTLASRAIAVYRYDSSTKTIGMRQVPCVLGMYAFRRLSEVRNITDHWIRQYNEERPHDSLGKLTPREYLTANSERENSKSSWH